MHPRVLASTSAAAVTACALGMTVATGLRVELSHLLLWAAGICVLFALQAFYTFYRREPFIADSLGTLAVTGCSLTMLGVLALAGLAVNAPLIDGALIRADEMIGLDARTIVAFVSRVPALHHPLVFAYHASFKVLIFVPLILILMRRADAAWRFCAMIALAGFACALIAIPFPAIGAFAGLQLAEDVVSQLPEGAGLYHLATFDAFRSGTTKHVRLSELNGVITFPSFHAAFACVTAHVFMSLRILPVRLLRLSILIWTAIVMVSTIVIGGHYFVDVFAGVALFAVVVSITRTRKPSPDLSMPLRALNPAT